MPTTLPRRAGDFVRKCVSDVQIECRLPRRRFRSLLPAGKGHGFSDRHFQSFAQRREICITWANSATFPVIDRNLRDA
jgi:hypothetical protein